MLDRAMMEDKMVTAHKNLSGYCEQAIPWIRRVQRLLNSLLTVWKELMKIHVSYLSEKEMEMGSNESKIYLNKQRVYRYLKGL